MLFTPILLKQSPNFKFVHEMTAECVVNIPSDCETSVLVPDRLAVL